MNEKAKIFLVEDDFNISAEIKSHLEMCGYNVVIASNFTKIYEEFEQAMPSLVLLDIMLPAFNGFYWCQEIRRHYNTPIIFISSRSDDFDLIQAMQLGGDDYITKPVSIEVIRAKVQAVLRRSYDFNNDSNIIKYNNLTLNIGKAEISLADNDIGGISITKTELLIIKELIEAKGDVVARNKLIDTCWQRENFIDDNTLAVNISRLRSKLSRLGLSDRLSTKRGIGYFLK